MVSHLPETLNANVLLLGQLRGELAHGLQSHLVTVEVETQREAGVGGLKMQVDQAIDCGSTSVE